MGHQITTNCINCDRCRPLCPTGAIQTNNHQGLYIDSSLCNDCTGHYGTPQCASVCPTNQGCVSIHNTEDYWENWFSRYERLVKNLKNGEKTHYWETWFDTYSEKLSSLIS